VDVRPEQPEDASAVESLVAAAFADGGEVARLVRSLRRLVVPSFGASLVAVVDGALVGHVMCTRSLLDAPRRLLDVQVLSPLAVAPAHQGQGIGGTLVRAAIAGADLQGAPVLFLEGSPAYYPRFGFAPGGELGFRKPSLRIPDPAFQALRLGAWEPWMVGTLVYAHEFWDHDAVGLREPGA
jgi:putative acetyltransferase